MKYVPWKTFGRIIDRHSGHARVRTLDCAQTCLRDGFLAIDVARVFAQHRVLSGRQPGQTVHMGLRGEHGSCRNRSASHEASPVGSSILQPPELWSRTMLPVAGAPRLTGTSVSDNLDI